MGIGLNVQSEGNDKQWVMDQYEASLKLNEH